MNIHEYQAKEILKKYKVAVPKYGVAASIDEALTLYDELGGGDVVVKIQVHAGGRGKAGGVKFAKTRAEVESVAAELIGMRMQNNQTGPEGVIAHKVMLSVPVDIKKEYYIGAIIDRESAQAILIASPEGGMEIEEIAIEHPEKILKLPIDGKTGEVKQIDKLAPFMGWEGESAKEGTHVGAALAKLFIEKDASLLEINPLVLSNDGKIWALDAKLGIDDNALFRHPDLAQLYDPTQQSANEVEASKHDLEYIALEGNIGCMVNGAGLAMATMDIIDHYGGKPANFLDVGGSASKEKVASAFKIILADKNVKAILVNIFGGIMSCQTLAEGIVAAAKETKISVPLVVRLEGTHVDEGKRILNESGLKLIAADSLGDAAEKAVAAIGGN